MITNKLYFTCISINLGKPDGILPRPTHTITQRTDQYYLPENLLATCHLSNFLGPLCIDDNEKYKRIHRAVNKCYLLNLKVNYFYRQRVEN